MKLFHYNKETLTFDKVRIKPKTYLITAAAIGGIYWLGWVSNIQIVDRIIHRKSTDTVLVHGQPFSEEALIELIKDCNLKYPHIVLAQAKVESGHYKSRIFKQNNNLFGMRRARIRVPRPAASVVISCAFCAPTRLRHSINAFLDSSLLVASKIVVTLGSFSPSGVAYLRLPSISTRLIGT